MRRCRFLIGLLTVAAALVAKAGAPVDEQKPYGRAALAVRDARRYDLLNAETRIETGSIIVPLVDSNTPCMLLIAAFSAKDRRLLWRPAWLKIDRFSDKDEVLKDGPTWTWNAGAGPAEVWALFVDPASPQAAALSQLVTSITQAGDVTPEPLAQRLREAITRSLADDLAARTMKVEPIKVGGALRGPGEWRDSAPRVQYSRSAGGLLVFTLP